MTSHPEPSIPQNPGLSGLPDFLFGAWRLRALDISEAEDRDELRGWTVSSLCSTYFRYQLERHQRQLEAVSILSHRDHHLSSLASRGRCVGQMLGLLTANAAVVVVCAFVGVGICENPLRPP